MADEANDQVTVAEFTAALARVTDPTETLVFLTEGDVEEPCEFVDLESMYRELASSPRAGADTPTRTQRFTVTVEQLRAFAQAFDDEVHTPGELVTLIGTDDLRAQGLDLPDGTVELRCRDYFSAVKPDGTEIENGG